MQCPTCEQTMHFLSVNQNWWCNSCLKAVEGPAPEGMAGPTAEQVEAANSVLRHQKAEEGPGLSLSLLFLIPAILAGIGGIFLITVGHAYLGAGLLFLGIGGFAGDILFY